MKKGLTTHILDLTRGIPATNLKVELWRILGINEEKQFVSSSTSDHQGRIESKLLERIVTGEYELVFYIGNYYQQQNFELADPIFLNKVPVRFSLNSEHKHYHIPLLISPWGYQTYRGS